MRARLAVPAVAVLALLSYGAADAVDVAPGALTLAAPVPAPTPAPRPTPSDPPRASTGPVLAGLSAQALAPTSAGVARTLGPLLASPALGSRVSAYVVDAVSGDVLLDSAGQRPQVPASTAKLLTGAAVLATVGGSTRLSTRAVQGAPDEVILVGGGDMLLGPAGSTTAVAGRAGLDDLASQVVAALTADGQTEVVVRFDDTAFAGPNAAPGWAAADLSFGYAGRVAALGLASDRARPGRPSSTDPALTAAQAFGAALVRAGVAVSGAPVRAVAPEQARVLGEVASAPVAEVLALALAESDNALAEALARLVARALGRPTTFKDAAAAVLDAVQELGVDTGPTTISDTSGLAPGSLVPARVLGDVLALGAGPGQPQLRPLLEGLPVAGFSGTLADRFGATRTRGAAGVVRAKTGTLTGSSAIAGTTVDDDGRLLLFVVMADRVPASGTLAARAALDRVTAALAACGCR